MIESVLYTVTRYARPFLVVSIVILIIGCILDYLTKKFDIHRKSSRYLGLLTGMNSKQNAQLCTLLIRTILVIYYVIATPDNIESVLVMLATTTIIYMVLTPKRIVYEVVNTAVQGTVIYFKSIIHDYRIGISSENYVFQVEMILIMLVIIYTIYFFLRNIEDIVDPANRKKVKKIEKG